MLVFFLWIMWFFLLFRVIGDVFRSDDLGGWAKSAWLILVLVVPFLGIFLYERGTKRLGLGDVAPAHVVAAGDHLQSYVRDAGSGGSVDQLAKLADLKDRGIIKDVEFEQQKAKLLS